MHWTTCVFKGTALCVVGVYSEPPQRAPGFKHIELSAHSYMWCLTCQTERRENKDRGGRCGGTGQ